MARDPLMIEYYTDVLCIWAWVAQRRVEEVLAKNGSNVQFQHRYLDLFGDTRTRIYQQWESRGQYQGFCDHVCNAAAPFSSAPVNPACWSRVRPHTSANAHLAIKAVEQAEGIVELFKIEELAFGAKKIVARIVFKEKEGGTQGRCHRATD